MIEPVLFDQARERIAAAGFTAEIQTRSRRGSRYSCAPPRTAT